MGNEFWTGRRVLVTGCTGILGSWLTHALIEAHAEVIGLVHARAPESNLFRLGTHACIVQVDGDLTEYHLLERVLNEYEIEVVFHLAAQSLVHVASQQPVDTFETNVRGTWLLLEACRLSKTVKRIVVASSYRAYGVQGALPYTEAASLEGRSAYDTSKACTDLIAQAFAHTYELPLAVTRCGNIYGSGDLNWDRLVPGAMRSVVCGEPPVIRSDGTLQRDYLYVDDAVAGYLCLAERLDDTALYGQAFNFGMDAPRSVLEIVETIIGLSDHAELKPIILNSAGHEIQQQYLSSEKARRVLGWQPRYSLEAGLRQTLAWYRAYLSMKETSKVSAERTRSVA
ncbi:MAG TPA: GDP-mannose 4,6-dehydratase [Anaerolineae bacterium]|nr:GDP-mannose 4,6-dehydratase [Anaerolineae bacterium]